jgi:hypothetical protein
MSFFDKNSDDEFVDGNSDGDETVVFNDEIS